MLMDIDIYQLIKEIKTRPGLYDTGAPDYFDRVQKKELWKEVFLKLNSDLESYSNKEKNEFGKEVQKRWNSLRDCFRRELLHQQSVQSASGVKRKRQYRYFDELLFLQPHTLTKNCELCLNNQEKTSHENCNDDDAFSSEENKNQELTEVKDIKNTAENCATTAQKTDINTTDYGDDDKLFLLSLLPSFKNSTLEEKYLLRIEIMKTIMEFKKSRRESKPDADEAGMERIQIKTECKIEHFSDSE